MSPTREAIAAQLEAEASDHVGLVCAPNDDKLTMMRALSDDQRVRVSQLEACLELLEKKIAIRKAGGDFGNTDDFARAYLRLLGNLHTDAWMVHQIALDMIKDTTDMIEKWGGKTP